MSKRIITTVMFVAMQLTLFACPVCERNKPEILKGITHSNGPDSNWDYIIVIAVAIIAVLTLVYSIKWLIKPNESANDHIKLSILNEQ